MSKKVLTKKIIISKIHKKLGGALNKRLIRDAVNAVCVSLQEQLFEDQAISIENFGTLSPCVFHQHKGVNIHTGRIQEVPSFRTIKFHPHFVFLDLLSRRRDLFLEKK